MLHNELSELIGSQVKMDQLRRQEAETYLMSKAEQGRGLEGILLAMSLLMVHFGSDAAPQCSCRDRQWHYRFPLETVEPDMSKTLPYSRQRKRPQLV